MSGTHGVFQHRTGYFYTILEEDFCEIYKAEGVNEVCRAYITSILENLTNKQFDENNHDEDIWVFMSLPEMARRMRNAYSERTIHKEIQGMIKDGYLKKRRAEHKATMEYCLNLKKIRDGLASLPDKQSCNSATYHLANLQDQSGKTARLTLQNCKNDLAELQPRVSKRITIEETREKERKQSVPETDSPSHSSTHSLSQVEQMSTELSTPVDKQASSKPQLPIATVTTGNTSNTPHVRTTEPLLSAEGSRVRDYWSQLGFESTSASHSHWNTLSKHIQTFEQMKSLFEFARAQLATAKDPTVHPGNLVKAVNGWKQKQAPPPDKPSQPKSGKPRDLGAEMRKMREQYTGIAASGK